MSSTNQTNTNQTTVVSVKKAELKKRGISDFKEWNEQKDTVYIGRNMSFYVKGTNKSKWHNPYSAKKYGLERCLELYREYITNNTELLGQLDELKGMELGCWCKPNRCHGDILVELVNKL